MQTSFLIQNVPKHQILVAMSQFVKSVRYDQISGKERPNEQISLITS